MTYCSTSITTCSFLPRITNGALHWGRTCLLHCGQCHRYMYIESSASWNYYTILLNLQAPQGGLFHRGDQDHQGDPGEWGCNSTYSIPVLFYLCLCFPYCVPWHPIITRATFWTRITLREIHVTGYHGDATASHPALTLGPLSPFGPRGPAWPLSPCRYS